MLRTLAVGASLVMMLFKLEGTLAHVSWWMVFAPTIAWAVLVIFFIILMGWAYSKETPIDRYRRTGRLK